MKAVQVETTQLRCDDQAKNFKMVVVGIREIPTLGLADGQLTWPKSACSMANKWPLQAQGFARHSPAFSPACNGSSHDRELPMTQLISDTRSPFYQFHLCLIAFNCLWCREIAMLLCQHGMQTVARSTIDALEAAIGRLNSYCQVFKSQHGAWDADLLTSIARIISWLPYQASRFGFCCEFSYDPDLPAHFEAIVWIQNMVTENQKHSALSWTTLEESVKDTDLQTSMRIKSVRCL